MRLISQDRTVDMSYETITVKISEVNDRWVVGGYAGNHVSAVLGEYSSKAIASAVLAELFAQFRNDEDVYYFPSGEEYELENRSWI